MHTIKKLSLKIKQSFEARTNLFVVVFLAIVTLVTALAVNYVFNYLGDRLTSQKLINDWEYIYSENADANFRESSNFANIINPISRKKSGSYLHLKTTVDESDSDRTLIIKSDYSPIKVSIGGEEVYNNHYTESEYVGNTYNAVTLPSSRDKTEVEISCYLPFSADVDVSLSDYNATPEHNFGIGFYLVAILTVLCIAVLIISLFLRKSKIHNSRLYVVFPLAATYTAVLLIKIFSHNSYLINFPQFYNITLAAENLLTALLLFTALKKLKIKSKRENIFIILYALCSLLTIPLNTTLLLNIGMALSGVLGVVAIAVFADTNRKLIDHRVQYSKSAYCTLFALAMFYFLGRVTFFLPSQRTDYEYCIAIGTLLFLAYIIFIFISKAFSYQDSQTMHQKLDSYDKSIENITNLMERILRVSDESEIYPTVANGISDFCKEISKEAQDGEIRFCVCKKENSAYKVVCNTPSCEAINCGAIENRCLDTNEHCMFGETFFDFTVLKNGTVDSIFHFENIDNALDSFFRNIIEALCCAVNVAVSNFSKSNGELPTEFYIEMLTEAESDNKTSAEHLRSVEFYTKLIAEEMGYPPEICDSVSKASLFHDIGKIAIPNEITEKNGLLSDEERLIIQKHTDYGYKILSVFDSDFMRKASIIANEHHENYDGTGYRKISGESIDEYARIVSVADTLDALTSKRSYKEAMPLEEAINYIDLNSGKIFDPKVVTALHGCIEKIELRRMNNER